MILDKVRDTIRKYHLIDKNAKLVVGVSGGPDSTALLYLLNSLKKEFKLALHIAHLDHMLRKSSHRDREYVEDLARKLKLPLSASSINVKKLADRGSTEEIARNARLDFLFKVAKQVKATKIALGHTLDDQAETVLMRILRGTGLYGLSGIMPKRDFGAFHIIRPLIEVRRKEVEAYLKRKRINPRRDVSNREEIYFRNKIRKRLLPLLEKKYNKNIKEVLSNMAKNVGDDYDYLYIKASRIMKQFGSRIDLERFLKLHPAMQRLLLRMYIAKLKGDTRRITFQHIKEIEDLILNRPLNSIVDLPKGISVIKKKKSLSFYLR